MPLAKQKALPSVQLIHGDCLEVMPTLPANSAQMVFADLPYGLPSTSLTWDLPIPLKPLWSSLAHMADKKCACVFTATQPFSSILVMSNVKAFRYAYVWQKNRATNFFNAKRQPLRNHEDVLVFSSGVSRYVPQMKPGSPYSTSRKPSISKQFNASFRSASRTQNNGERYPLTVQSFALETRAELIHPTQKPVAFLDWLIRTYTNEGDTVLDPVFGSATTAIACLRAGRNFIGIEKDAEYFRIGSERVRAEQERLSQMG